MLIIGLTSCKRAIEHNFFKPPPVKLGYLSLKFSKYWFYFHNIILNILSDYFNYTKFHPLNQKSFVVTASVAKQSQIYIKESFYP